MFIMKILILVTCDHRYIDGILLLIILFANIIYLFYVPMLIFYDNIYYLYTNKMIQPTSKCIYIYINPNLLRLRIYIYKRTYLRSLNFLANSFFCLKCERRKYVTCRRISNLSLSLSLRRRRRLAVNRSMDAYALEAPLAVCTSEHFRLKEVFFSFEWLSKLTTRRSSGKDEEKSCRERKKSAGRRCSRYSDELLSTRGKEMNLLFIASAVLITEHSQQQKYLFGKKIPLI